ncbi:hypothetical protein GCM10023221_00510 [Luteimicrobium xylanilyticum]
MRDDEPGDPGREDGVPARDRAHAVDDLLRSGVLEREAARTAASVKQVGDELLNEKAQGQFVGSTQMRV